VFDYADGSDPAPEGPGLGVEMAREAVETGPDWHSPVRRHETGSVAEW